VAFFPVVQPGTYTMVLARRGARGPGDFPLRLTVTPVRPFAGDVQRLQELRFEETAQGATTRRRFAAYRFHVDRGMTVTVHVAAPPAIEGLEVSILSSPADLTLSHADRRDIAPVEFVMAGSPRDGVTTWLEPGDYVFRIHTLDAGSSSYTVQLTGE
jgi:hypothetical protein